MLLLIVGFAILIFGEIAKVYFIMPFPGSQVDERIQLAYFIHNNIGFIRLAGFLLIGYPLYYYYQHAGMIVKITLGVVLGFYGVVFYMFNFRFLADKMFLEPKQVDFLSADKNKKVKDDQLVIGVALNGEAKAYPIEIIGYHHQVRDVVGNNEIMVTYCTVCRTGRVYRPAVEGQPEKFRLVGMDHFNAMFEDSRTKSWWRQVNGVAVAGSLTGKSLPEVPSQQMSLAAWKQLYPNTLIMQPDSTFKEAYESLADYDEGTRKGKLTRHDTLSWKDKSWVVGIPSGLFARAYDWNDLKALRMVQDEVGGTKLVLTLESDKMSFHAWKRDSLDFKLAPDSVHLNDAQTGSTWSMAGECVDGQLRGTKLESISAYQEYWHSWKTFHPQTDQYLPAK